jgi:hypothetical protein
MFVYLKIYSFFLLGVTCDSYSLTSLVMTSAFFFHCDLRKYTWLYCISSSLPAIFGLRGGVFILGVLVFCLTIVRYNGVLWLSVDFLYYLRSTAIHQDHSARHLTVCPSICHAFKRSNCKRERLNRHVSSLVMVLFKYNYHCLVRVLTHSDAVTGNTLVPWNAPLCGFYHLN